MRAQITTLIIVICTLSSSVKAEWRVCSAQTNFILNVTAVEILPYPITASSITHFQIIGHQNEGIYSGTLEASVKYLGFRVFKKSGDLCDLEGGPVKCPLLPGHVALDLEETMPGFLPPGKMILTLQASRNDSLPLFCVDIDLNSSKNAAKCSPRTSSSPLIEDLVLGTSSKLTSFMRR